ncbi:MAG: hypothetical protein OXE02_13650 [Chloroflexi bacterium]|nr:hypothetical protein [Chloroflexota bacterium]
MVKWIPVLVLVLTLHLTLLACSAEEPSSPPSAEGTAATPTPTPVPTDTPTSTPQPAATPTPVAERDTVADTPASTPQPPATPTPVAEVQVGAELITEEYARAVEEILNRAAAAIEATTATLVLDRVLSEEVGERMQSLETSESWSDDDAEFASQYAESLLEAVTGLIDLVVRVSNETLDEMSRLRPPERLSDLHGEYSAALGEVTHLLQTQVEILKNTDTEIKNRQELAAFQDTLDGTPELQLKAAYLGERRDEACIALKEQLEAELEREVSFGCN